MCFVKVYCDGPQSCEYSEIRNINTIKANGNDSLSGSTIFSEGSASLIMDVNGTNSEGYTLYCNNTDICKIRCHSRDACSLLFIYCFGTCYVDCDNVDILCPAYGAFDFWTTSDPTTIPSTIPMGIQHYFLQNIQVIIPQVIQV